MLCLHLPGLLPSRHADVEISSIVQTAALTGLGLLHCRTGHRLMIEFFLAELTRKSTSDHCDTREAMALSTGWALGMVLLSGRRGDNLGRSVADLAVEDRLQLLITGGQRSESVLFTVCYSLGR